MFDCRLGVFAIDDNWLGSVADGELLLSGPGLEMIGGSEVGAIAEPNVEPRFASNGV